VGWASVGSLGHCVGSGVERRATGRTQKETRVLHHVELYVSDLERSMVFWEPFMERLGYRVERWSGGVNFVQGPEDAYLCFLAAPADHPAAGYHRRRVGLNHLAFHGRSRAHVDELTGWVRQEGHTLLYEDRHPYAGGPGYYALYCEDPDRIKVEVVAPGQE
jgi:catechol 2,3-dioxygenase-like lactoylglutathione lyase family enzyme